MNSGKNLQYDFPKMWGGGSKVMRGFPLVRWKVLTWWREDRRKTEDKLWDQGYTNTNNLKLYKKIQWKSETANFSVLARGRRPRN